MSDDFFAELEQEISKHTAKTQMRKDAAKLKKDAMNRAMDEVARLAARRAYNELQAILDIEIWRPISLVAFFTEQVCDGCGSVHRNFLQYMEEQHHRQQPRNKRWVRVSRPEPYLPKTVLIQSHTTHVCIDCCGDHGFVVGEAHRINMPFSLSIAPNYEQGDINAPSQEDRPTASDGVATAGECSLSD